MINAFFFTYSSKKKYWNTCRSEITNMISQIGFPTFLFTLSASDTKWSDLHKVMPNYAPVSPQNIIRWRIDNVINYPYIVAKYMHEHFSIFCEEIIAKYLHAKDMVQVHHFLILYLNIKFHVIT